jgi:hypothetical protein
MAGWCFFTYKEFFVKSFVFNFFFGIFLLSTWIRQFIHILRMKAQLCNGVKHLLLIFKDNSGPYSVFLKGVSMAGLTAFSLIEIAMGIVMGFGERHSNTEFR